MGDRFSGATHLQTHGFALADSASCRCSTGDICWEANLVLNASGWHANLSSVLQNNGIPFCFTIRTEAQDSPKGDECHQHT